LKKVTGARTSLYSTAAVTFVLLALVASCTPRRGPGSRPRRAGVVRAAPSPTEASPSTPIPGPRADRSPEGALAAAEEIQRLLGSEVLLDADRRRLALDSVLDPGSRSDVEAQYDAALAQLEQRTGWVQDATHGIPVLMRSAVFGARVPSYDGVSARVELWIASVAGTARTGPVDEAWGTAALSLRWSDARWRLASISTAEGPAPTEALSPPAPPAELYAWAASGRPANEDQP